MLQLTAVTRAAWLPTAVRHATAAAAGRRTGKRRTLASSPSAHTNLPTHRRRCSLRTSGVKNKRKPSSAAERSNAVASTAASTFEKLRDAEWTRTTKGNTPTIPTTTTVSATTTTSSSSSSSSSGIATPEVNRPRCTQAPRCWAPPDTSGWNASYDVVQRRIRSRLAQLVLLSPTPLRPSQLFVVYRRTLDADTASMLAWASYAVSITDAAAGQAWNGAEPEAAAEAIPADSSSSSSTTNNEDGRIPLLSAEMTRTLQRQGESFVRAYRASVVPSLMAALQDRHARSAVATASKPEVSLPAAQEVERWVYLSILFTDPEFRVTFYGGYVCYPVAPALLLATVDPVRDHEVRRTLYAAQWKTKRTAAQRSEFVASALASTTTSATPAAAAVVEEEGGPAPETLPDTTDATTTTCVTAPSYARTAWLNGAAGAPEWTTAHAILLSFLSPKWRMSTATPPSSSSSSNSGGGGVGGDGGDGGLAVDKALRRAVATVLAGTGTSGHLLVDAMLPALSANGFCDDARADAVTAAARTGAGTSKPRAMAAAAQPATQGWNEGKRSINPAMRVVDEMSEGGPLADEVSLLSSRSLATTPLYELNRRLLPTFFRRLTDMPISVARLATMLRWNLSVAGAAHYHSLFYFLLLLGANPLLRRMTESHRSLRRVNGALSDVWGTGDAAAAAAVAPEGGADDGAIRDAVQRELIEHDPTAFASLTNTPARGEALPASAMQLRRALRADANVVTALTAALRPVEELMCVRVLPRARRGSTEKAASTSSPSSSSFFGFALHYIEVLPTWQWSPEEVVHYLRTEHETSPTSAAKAKPLEATWLASCEEPYLLVWCVSHSWLDLRLRQAAELYLDVVVSQRHKGKERDGRPPLVLSIRRLAVLLLWTHEYGAAMAAELLFVSLLTCREQVLLHPPKAATAASPSSPVPSTDYGGWKVEFLQ